MVEGINPSVAESIKESTLCGMQFYVKAKMSGGRWCLQCIVSRTHEKKMRVRIVAFILTLMELFQVPLIYSFRLSNFEHISRVKPYQKQFSLQASLKEDDLTRLIEDYDFQGAYEMIRNDPMLKISRQNARKILNNIRKVDQFPVPNSRAELSKKVFSTALKKFSAFE